MPQPWYWVSAIAFFFAIVSLMVSGAFFFKLLRVILPLLTDTRAQVQDLGDLAANSVGRAVDTMELVEIRVSQTMGQATQAGKAATQQALGLGTAVAGVYFVARFISTFRGQFKSKRSKRRR